MPVTLIDWSVPITIILCGISLIAIKYMGFATSRWGYALCSLGIGYAVMLLETDHATPYKQIVEDNFILVSVILACRALNDRLNLRLSFRFDVALLLALTIMITISRTIFESVRLETLFVLACCAFVLWKRSIGFSRIAVKKSDKLLSATFLLFAMLLTGQCLLYIAAPEIKQTTGAWRSTVWGNLVQYTGLIGSISLVFSVMIATSYDSIEQYRIHAYTDPLTNLFNRRGLAALLASPRGKGFRAESTAVIMADIDHFKTINDRFGHSFGDVVISRFAGLLQAQVASHGCVVRLGGEEFAVLLPNTRVDDAITAADKMRQAFVVESWPPNETDIKFTACFGVTSIKTGEGLSTVFDRADHLLYAAKRAGRNCVAAEKYRSSGTDGNGALIVGQAVHVDVAYFPRAANEN